MAMSGMVTAGRGGARLLLVSTLAVIFSARAGRAQKGDACGDTLLGPSSGTLSSINYPQTYPNHTVCEWELRVSPGRRIHLKFGDFDIEDWDCHFSYLRIYNGIGPGRAEIAKYCGLGLQIPELILSSGSEVTVQFMSGTHRSGRGFLLSYSTTEHSDLITCLDKGIHFTEAEFSKYCPAGCLTISGEVSGTIPHGYRDSSSVCLAGIHAGVVSNTLGGQISVVSSKGIPHYESTLANNVTSTFGPLSNSLFTFKTSGCYGTLGLESGVVRSSQITSSSVWEWSEENGQPSVWQPSGARLKRPGLPWAAAHSDQHQWLQLDLKKRKRITGIITTGSTLMEYQFFVSAYRVQYSQDGQLWYVFREADADQDKIFQGNINYLHEVRNNFIPPMEARYVRVSPTQWHQRIALKMELLGCQPPALLPRTFQPRPTKLSTDPPLQRDKATFTPDIRNTTMTPSGNNSVALAAVLVPALVTGLTCLLLTLLCTWHCKTRKKSAKGAYGLVHWDRAGLWKGMKQFFPAKMSEGDDSFVRYSHSDANHARSRKAVPVVQAESAEYAQPLVGGMVGTLGQRSTFKPEEGSDPAYADPDPYDAPLTEIYHAYAQPLPASGAEYATPIVVDMAGHPAPSGPLGQVSVSTFKRCGPGPLLTRTDSGQSGSCAQYDTPKTTPGQTQSTEDLVYQVPLNGAQKAREDS
ncbi:discoidin, CUB and LCCL domain-containing protein 2 isoform X1 [Brienomyrus brachyistius]|uniref:discoidin, CUB and LCCL domain-containing protein 2 isoform X1 n=2 Tax=Brienomyrus brachyistius TaxID=42636 RepID=UPI0020B3B767|nr:discoidin, CUB and LCCL domain-containing protein 2 isoform X1 [Brienomyrus brachyistius]